MSRKATIDAAGAIHHINIFYSEDDEGYIADIPDLDACSAFGETPDEAVLEVQQAKKLRLEAARTEGKPLPNLRLNRG